MQRVPAERGVKLLNLELLGLQFFVAGGGVARRGLAFLAGFAAFDGDDFSGHKLFFFFRFWFFGFFAVFRFNFRDAGGID